MARRQKTSLLEDLAELTSHLPWWVGVLLAVVSYFLFGWLATPDPVKTIALGQTGDFAGRVIAKAFAKIGQYVLPIIFIGGALWSAFRRWTRTRLVSQAASGTDKSVLDGMSWQQFELLVGDAFRLDGFNVEGRGGAAPDGGIDIVVTRQNEKYFVQCKHWKSLKVGVDVVRELYGVMAAHGAVGGFVVTSGSFTADAIEFASGRNVILVDGPVLYDMIRRARSVPTSNPAPRINPLLPPPNCPDCGSAMVARAAKHGLNAGGSFWGCSRYPKCRGTRAIA
ncbi:MAG: restriction endonuclease [Rhodocyclaceae bacterium]|nr:restriction endonuclease [Rhodocyclaceae bacterium]